MVENKKLDEKIDADENKEDKKINYIASTDTIFLNKIEDKNSENNEDEINLNEDETGDINMETNNANENIEDKSDNEKIDEDKIEEIAPIKPPEFIKSCEDQLIDITKGFANLYTISEKHSEVKNLAEDDLKILNNYIDNIKADKTIKENQIINIQKEIDDTLKTQVKINEKIKDVSENISKICSERKMDK